MGRIETRVFIETNVLVASSIHYNANFFHKFYDTSKSLFNLFEKYGPKQFGWVSETVLVQSNTVLEKACKDVIRESNTPTSDIEQIQLFSDIRDSSRDRFEKNKKLLKLKLIDQSKADKIFDEEVTPFFIKIKDELSHPQQVSSQGYRLGRSLRRRINGGNKQKYKTDMPDKKDKEILSEAIYLKRRFLITGKLLLASLDGHFCPYQGDSWARDKIYTSFEVFCDKPTPIYNELQKKWSE